MVFFVFAVPLGCYQTLDLGMDTGAGDLPTLALDGPCSRYAWLALEGMSLRMVSDEPCAACGVSRSLAPDEHGYRSRLRRDDGTVTTAWSCNNQRVSVRQLTYDGDETDVDAYDPPVVRWVEGKDIGESWTTNSEVTRMRNGVLQDVSQVTVTYTVEGWETLSLAPGDFETVRLREEESGALRWISEGFGLVQVVDENGTSVLSGLSWPGEDTGQ